MTPPPLKPHMANGAPDQTIAVIDYGMGNLHSVASALQTIAPDARIVVTNDAEIIADADRVVFPGVGAIRDCMAEIYRLGVDKVVRSVIASGKPLLAICVGMQALMNSSEENSYTDCLGVIDGEVKFFSNNADFNAHTDESIGVKQGTGERLKVPHMGWNQVKYSDNPNDANNSHPMWAGIADGSRFYFVHSYYVALNDTQVQLGETHFGINFTAAVARGNIFAVQFHPEKSHKNGLQLLRNFVAWQP